MPDGAGGGSKLSALQAPGIVHGSVGSRRVAKPKRAVAGATSTAASAAVSDGAESDSPAQLQPPARAE